MPVGAGAAVDVGLGPLWPPALGVISIVGKQLPNTGGQKGPPHSVSASHAHTGTKTYPCQTPGAGGHKGPIPSSTSSPAPTGTDESTHPFKMCQGETGISRSRSTPGIGSSKSKWAMPSVGFASGSGCSSSLSAACNFAHSSEVGQSRSDCQ